MGEEQLDETWSTLKYITLLRSLNSDHCPYWLSKEETLTHEGERKKSGCVRNFTCLLIFKNLYRSVLQSCCRSWRSEPSGRRRPGWSFSTGRPAPAIAGLLRTSAAATCDPSTWRSSTFLWWRLRHLLRRVPRKRRRSLSCTYCRRLVCCP